MPTNAHGSHTLEWNTQQNRARFQIVRDLFLFRFCSLYLSLSLSLSLSELGAKREAGGSKETRSLSLARCHIEKIAIMALQLGNKLAQSQHWQRKRINPVLCARIRVVVSPAHNKRGRIQSQVIPIPELLFNLSTPRLNKKRILCIATCFPSCEN